MLKNNLEQIVKMIKRKVVVTMSGLTLLYMNEILKGNITNINDIPKLVRAKVLAHFDDYGLAYDENGNIYVKD